MSMPTLQYGSNFQMLKKLEVCVILAAEMNSKGEYTNKHKKNQDVSNEIITEKKNHIIGNDGLET
jgi:hypothetical protein